MVYTKPLIYFSFSLLFHVLSWILLIHSTCLISLATNSVFWLRGFSLLTEYLIQLVWAENFWSFCVQGRYDDENSDLQLASSPPFFCGSPPSRASNPLIQDAHFGNDNFVPIPQIPESAAAAPPPPFSSSGRMIGGGCVRVKFGNDSAPVRIEGFNCRGSCSISAVA